MTRHFARGAAALLLLVLTIACLSRAAHAQVASCPTATQGSAYSTCSSVVPENAPTADTLVLWCEWGSVGASSCPGWNRWIPWSSFGDSSLVLTTYAGLQRKGSVTFQAPTPSPTPTTGEIAPPPPCWPLLFRGRLLPVPTTVSTRFDTIGVWACDTPRGVYTHSIMFSFPRAKPVVEAVHALTKTSADTVYVENAKALTLAEAAFGDQTRAQFLPTAVVSTNGSYSTRPRYAVTPDGKLGARAGSAPVGAACVPWRRIVGTAYYELADAPGFAAVCTVTAPLGVN